MVSHGVSINALTKSPLINTGSDFLSEGVVMVCEDTDHGVGVDHGIGMGTGKDPAAQKETRDSDPVGCDFVTGSLKNLCDMYRRAALML